MKKFIATGLTVFTLLLGAATTSNAQTVAGLGASYGMDYEELGIKGEFYYDLSKVVPSLRLGGGFTYFLPKEQAGLTANFMLIEVNAQYLFINKDAMGVYGLAGLRHSRISYEVDTAAVASAAGVPDGFDVSSAVGDLTPPDQTSSDLQIGAGGEFKVSSIRLFGELLLGIGDNDELVLNFGARYPF